MSLLNPVDLGRILLLLNLDVSAMMGFTGAVFQRFFGSGTGQAVTLAAMSAWLAIPFLLGQRAFLRKNF
jgi:Cu-processing system permease protein